MAKIIILILFDVVVIVNKIGLVIGHLFLERYLKDKRVCNKIVENESRN